MAKAKATVRPEEMTVASVCLHKSILHSDNEVLPQ